MAGLDGSFFLVYHGYFLCLQFSVCHYVEPDSRRRRTESGGVSLDCILEPVKEELVSHFTFEDIVQLSYVCKFCIYGHIR